MMYVSGVIYMLYRMANYGLQPDIISETSIIAELLWEKLFKKF